jgi:hypothetical protein
MIANYRSFEQKWNRAIGRQLSGLTGCSRPGSLSLSSIEEHPNEDSVRKPNPRQARIGRHFFQSLILLGTEYNEQYIPHLFSCLPHDMSVQILRCGLESVHIGKSFLCVLIFKLVFGNFFFRRVFSINKNTQ